MGFIRDKTAKVVECEQIRKIKESLIIRMTNHNKNTDPGVYILFWVLEMYTCIYIISLATFLTSILLLFYL